MTLTLAIGILGYLYQAVLDATLTPSLDAYSAAVERDLSVASAWTPDAGGPEGMVRVSGGDGMANGRLVLPYKGVVMSFVGPTGADRHLLVYLCPLPGAAERACLRHVAG